MSTVSYPSKDFMADSYLDEMPCRVNGYRYVKLNGPRRVINIAVAAKGLPNGRLFTKSDPVCVLSLNGPRGFREFARTEVCWNSLEPYWVRTFTLGVKSESSEMLMFDIYDVVSANYNLENQVHLASAEIDLWDLLERPGQFAKLDLVNKAGSVVGKLLINFTECEKDVKGSLFFRFKADQLKSPSRTVRSANPFVIIQRLIPETSHLVNVYKSQIRNGTNYPEWKKVELALQFLCGGDLDLPIRFNILDYQPRGKDDVIGFFDTTTRMIMESGVSVFDIVSKKGQRVGKFTVEFIEKIEKKRFLDWQVEGIKMAPFLAIDFSSTDYDALYTNKVQHQDVGPFSYSYAINDVCDSVRPLTLGEPYLGVGFADYSSEKVWNLSMNKDRESVPTARTLLNMYFRAKTKATFPNRAPLAPVIARAREIAKKRWEDDRVITLVVVLTNGKFCDLQAAIDELVDAEGEALVTVIMVMDGTRRDLEEKIGRNDGYLVHSNGTVARRSLVHLLSYHTDKVYPDHKLSLRILPVIRRMACEYLEQRSGLPQ